MSTTTTFHKLPLLSQLTACESGVHDPIERFYLNPVDTECKAEGPSYGPEYCMGMNYRELQLKMAPNIVYVRSSVKRLLEKQKLALIPTEEVVDKLLNLQQRNLRCKLHERIRDIEVLPQREQEYRIRTFELDIPLSIISSDGCRQTYHPPFHNLPHVRSSAHPILVVRNAARAIFNYTRRGRPYDSIVDAKVIEIRMEWSSAPRSFAYKPDWQELTHPFERTDNIVADILDPKKDESVPDLIPDTSSSSSESSLDTELALHPEEWIQYPGTQRWTKRIRKIIGRNLPFEEEITNDKQLKGYAKERCRPFDEVMRTSRVSVRFEPYLRRKPTLRVRDDISIWFI